MKTSLLQCVLFLFVCVVFAQENTGKPDFSSFEKSLMEPQSSSSDAEKAPVESESASDAFERSLMASDSTSSDFEKSLMERPSELEPIYKLRENLLSAIKSKDTVTASNIISQLSEHETRSFVPIQYMELEVVYIEMNMYGHFLDMLLKYYKTLLDSNRYDENLTFASEDGLALYVKNQIMQRDTTRNVFFAISNKINYARISMSKKLKLEILLLLRDAYRDENVGSLVRDKASRFVKEYGDDPDAAWIKKCILDPLSRKSPRELALIERAERHEDVIEEKLYTGGFGMNLFFIKGGFGLGFDRLYRSDLYEPVNPFVNLELYFQIGPFTTLLEMLNHGVNGVTSFGLGLGLVVYDSRYFKVRPYIEYALPGMDLKVKKDNRVEHLYAGDDEMYGFSEENRAFVAAVNVDYKFGTPYFFGSRSKLTSFSISGKFGVSYINLEDSDHFSGSGVSFFFDIGLGIYLW
ncbi:MAG: hypothetical protein J6W54_15210 [Fibrobacter sp.]|uniref:hypothetical protein n=1 Tax=Fibrobacter sp. TaxID=35828 RepID=UPI001B18EEE5|nr:hypothetical protein [Fibrobacter sp.]MBO7062418.1 hypothetical protein [Fibrobacter sp.]